MTADEAMSLVTSEGVAALVIGTELVALAALLISRGYDIRVIFRPGRTRDPNRGHRRRPDGLDGE